MLTAVTVHLAVDLLQCQFGWGRALSQTIWMGSGGGPDWAGWCARQTGQDREVARMRLDSRPDRLDGAGWVGVGDATHAFSAAQAPAPLTSMIATWMPKLSTPA